MQCQQCQKREARKRFCSNKCKDRWHNTHNPRGLGIISKIKSDDDDSEDTDDDDVEDGGWDSHKGYGF